jgi:hypothetical protein
LRLSWADFGAAAQIFLWKTPDRAEKILQRAPGKRNTTEVFRTEVDFEQVLYRLALHAQSLFTAAACLGRAQVVLPGGDSAADLASATLLKLLDPLDTSVTWSPTKDHPLPLGFWHICARSSDATSSIWFDRSAPRLAFTQMTREQMVRVDRDPPSINGPPALGTPKTNISRASG